MTSLQGKSAVVRLGLSRIGAMVSGGFAGGASAGVFGNVTSTVAVDLATGRPITSDQIGTAVVHGIAIDGPLGAVGATTDRLLNVARFPGTPSNVAGAEGEFLVGRRLGIAPTSQTNQTPITVGGNVRHPDFPITETFPNIAEVKNKVSLAPKDLAQIRDEATFAMGQGGDVIVFHRPGMDTSPLAGIGNVQIRPIPQDPLVVPIPRSFADTGRGDGGNK